jgi:hypothetical protein
MPTDPASAAALVVPTVNLTFQPHWGSGSLGNGGLETQGTRFPLIGIAYPVTAVRGMVTLSFGGMMDQRWELRRERTVDLAGEPTPATDVFKSDGGVSALRVGWAQNVGDNLALAVAVGTHTGSVTRTFVRSFDSLAVGTQVVAFTDGGKWQFSGLTTSLGFRLRAFDLIHLGGTVTMSGDLEADPSAQTKGSAATYSLPAEFRLGVTGVLTPRLSLHVGGSYANWEPSDDGLEPESLVGGVFSYGGGLEWAGPGPGDRTLPIRFGYRRTEFPFRFDESDPVESTFSGGLGLNFTQVETVVLAGVDLAIERGTREAGSLSETFWRGTLSVRVASW